MIKFFDSNVHLHNYKLDLKDNKVDNVLKNLNFEKNLTNEKLNLFIKIFENDLKKIRLDNYNYNLMLFDEKIFDKKINFDKIFGKIKSKTVLANFRIKKLDNYVQKLIENKINAVKFHRYFQDIKDSDIGKCINLVKKLDKLKIPILIDTSYGSEKMYTHNNLEFAIEILKYTKETKVVLLHSGALKVMEAYLISHQFHNVILDTSFSLDFYKNFRILEDYVRVYSKLGPKRIIYGSDFPYVDLKSSINNFLSIMKRCGFSNSEIKLISYKNSKKLFNNF